MKHEPAVRTHTPDDPPPTVIHHYEDDETILARWLRRAMARGASFWILAAGTVATVLAVGYLISGLMTGQSAASKAWGEVILAGSPEDLQRVAETNGTTPAGAWATLMAASARYREGISRLPADRDAAAPILSQALDGFEAARDKARNDRVLTRLAMLGVARTHETRNELDEAIAEYEKIARDFPDTDDGKMAAERAARLKSPEAVAFYKQFAAYKPKAPDSTTIGPRGTNSLGLPFGHPSVDGPVMPAPPLTGGIPAGSIPEPATSPAKTGGELPADPFQKSEPAGAGGAPKARTKDDSIPDVFPADPFQDGAGTTKPR